jgi:hypothetical protein
MRPNISRRSLLIGAGLTATGAWWVVPDDVPLSDDAPDLQPAAVCEFPDDAPHLMGGLFLEPVKATPDGRLTGSLTFANGGGKPVDLDRDFVAYRSDDWNEGYVITELSRTIAPGESYKVDLELATPDSTGTWIFEAGSAWAMGSCDLLIELATEITIREP